MKQTTSTTQAPVARQFVPIRVLFDQLAQIIADIIEHDDCSLLLYEDLTEITQQWEARAAKRRQPTKEAGRIRKTLGSALGQGERFGGNYL